MCRNIRPLFNFEPPATENEIEAAALQYVRKVSGFQKPSQVNKVAFSEAVREISRVTSTLIVNLETKAEPKDREVEAKKRMERNRRRFS